jgi:hypothetical protein
LKDNEWLTVAAYQTGMMKTAFTVKQNLKESLGGNITCCGVLV